MKNKHHQLISFFLVLIIMLSCGSVFGNDVEESITAGEESDVQLSLDVQTNAESDVAEVPDAASEKNEVAEEDFAESFDKGIDTVDMEVAEAVSKPLAASSNFDYSPEAQYIYLAEWQDPNYISDADFFGEYAGGVWVREGHLDYERISGLTQVRDAVQAGDYETAKEEYQRYSSDKFAEFSMTPAAMNQSALLTAQMLEYDLQWNSNSNITPLGIFTLGARRAETIVDMTATLSGFLGSEELAIYLIALKKDGSVAEFDSRNKQGGVPPTLEVTIDGVTQRLTATDDTYVSPSENHDQVYGMKDTFLVEESVSSIGAGKDVNGKTVNMPADKNTKRGVLKFDISSIPEGASISNAVLRLYGANVSTQGNTGEMQVAAFKIATTAWEEETMQFHGSNGSGFDHMIFSWYGEGKIGYPPTRTIYPINNPISRKPFCGHRFPEEIARMSGWLGDPITCYQSASDNNEHYAAIAIRQLVGFLEERGDDPFFDVAQPLDIANRANSMSQNCAKLVDSEHMTPEIWTALMKYIWAMGNGHADHYNGGTNGGTYQITGYNYLNSYYYEFREHYDWAERIRDYAAQNVDLTLHEDGSGIEGGLGYVVNSLRNMARWVEANEISGMTDEASQPMAPELKERIAQGLIYVMHMTGPGYVDNGIGDGGNYKTSYKDRFEIGGTRLDNPYLLYAGTEGKQGVQDPTTSVMYPVARRMVMRTGWGTNDLYLFNEVNGDQKHCQYDDNNIILFAYGKYLLMDPLYYVYTTGDPYAKKLQSSLQHNTVVINGKNQTSVTGHGDINLWKTNTLFDISDARTVKNADAVHDRSIVFIKPGYYIVSDYLTPHQTGVGQENTYHQYWHFLPQNGLEIDEDSGLARSNFAGEANLLIAQDSMQNVTGSIETDGLYSEGNSHLIENVPYVRYETKARGNVAFNTVLYPERAGGETELITEKLDVTNVNNNGVSAMKIQVKDLKENTEINAHYYMVHDTVQIGDRRYGDYRTDARFNYVEKNKADKLTRILMQGGSLIRDESNGKPIVKALKELDDFGVVYSGNVAEVASSDENFDITQVTFRTDSVIKEVRLNGTKIPFRTSGKYLFFGSTPIEENDEEPGDNESGSSANPGHGTGSGGFGGSSGSGGTGGGSQPSVTPTPDDNTSGTSGVSASQRFVDVTQEYAWAAEYIDALYQAGIVNGVDENNFAPGRSVTRAEYLKLLMSALEMEAETETRFPFVDVDTEHWAYGYIAAAYQAGIVNGISAQEFGAEEQISRQDLAVMTERALQAAGRSLERTTKEKEFADAETIAEYASESVKALQRYGILSGDESGSFHPLDSATRAESAKIIYFLIK